MNIYKYLFPLIMAIGVAVTAHAQGDPGQETRTLLQPRAAAGERLHFSSQGARMVINQDGSMGITVGEHFLSVVFTEKEGTGSAVIDVNGRSRVLNFASNGKGIQNFDGTGTDDPFHQFYVDLPPAEKANLDALKQVLADYANSQETGGPKVKSLTDCDTWIMFTLSSFVACPGSYGLGCLAGAYGLYRCFKTC
jgi:hypothetical protein